MPNIGSLFSTIRFPSPREIVQEIVEWGRNEGLWWGTSVLAHAVVLSAVFLMMGLVVSAPIHDEAPKFDSTVNTEVAEPPIEHFQTGEVPLDTTELTTETLTLTEAPPELAVDEQINGPADDEFSAAGGGIAAVDNAVSLGGLGGFDVRAIGPGAKVRGDGGVGIGIGTGNRPGSGGAGSGFGTRGTGQRKAKLGAYGGTKGSERSVGMALNWLARHQNSDGSWSLANYSRQCKDGSCAGKGTNADTAATALALLPFLAAGQTHESKGPYRKTVLSGLTWLTEHEKPNGDLGSGVGNAPMYAHGLATICLCEAYGLSRDKLLGEKAQQAINFTVDAQDPKGGGWRYRRHEPGDTSVVGWHVMALKSGMMAGLTVPQTTLEGANKFLTSVGNGTGGYGYTEKGARLSLSAVGLLCAQYLGELKTSPIIEGGTKLLMANLPDQHKNDCYYYYYATQVMHNVPGTDWDIWNRKMRKILIESQNKSEDECAQGSWDPSGDEHGKSAGGRIMVTALNTLTLEIYYRYLPLYKLDGKEKSELDK